MSDKYLSVISYKIIHIMFMLISISAYSQSIEIKGKIIDFDGKPVEGVFVYIVDNYIEMDTNNQGEFEFKIKNMHLGDTIVFSTYKKGYSQIKYPFIIKNKGLNYVEINLGEKGGVLEEIVISKPETSNKILDSSLFTKNEVEIILGSPEFSISSSMINIPAVQFVGESGDLSVRGGDGRETKYFFDGMLVQNMNGINIEGQAASSRLSPSLFKEIRLIPGGFSAEYGNALSSIVNMTSKDVVTEKSFNFLVSPFFIDIQSFIPINENREKSNNKQSIEVGVNVMNFDLYSKIFNTNLDYQKLRFGPHSLSWNFFYKNSVSDKLQLKLFSNNSITDIGAITTDMDLPNIEISSRIKNINNFNQLTFQYYPNTKTNFLFGINNVSNLDYMSLFKSDNTINYNKQSNVSQFKATVNRKIGRNTYLDSGAEYFIENMNEVESNNKLNYSNTYVGFYSEINTKVVYDIYTKVGLRSEYSWLIKKPNLGLRLDVKYFKNKNEIGFSYGDFYQQPWILNSLNLGEMEYTKANHYILYYHFRNNGIDLSLELYNKKYDNLLTYKHNKPIYNGNGYARGVEVYFSDNKSFKNLEYKLSYSYTDSKRKYLNYPIVAPFHFNSKNKFSASLNYSFFNGEYLLGLFYNYFSGRPFYNPNLSESLFNSEVTKDIHDLSSSLIYSFSIKNTPMLIILSVTNLLGNDKVYGYEYSKHMTNLSRVISPMYKRFFFLGINVSLGGKSNEDIINQVLNKK